MALLLPKVKRFSIDIDIIVPPGEIDLADVFASILKNSQFTRLEANERKAISQIDKAHYKFYYQPVTTHLNQEEYILLDILYEDNPYQALVERKVENIFLEVEGASVQVHIPSVEDILGDKLAAFAPNTTGVPYEKRGKGQEINIIKQLYDIGNLFNEAENIATITQTYY
ncbi:MAG: nucleotidyl transferase AbiEii/AbiGii toxin family protein [Bacteroidia bacterium]|nr:nucleotidyl transferase AbiEii/AbiGii toxin family protein [Bacteroidia bacterium]